MAILDIGDSVTQIDGRRGQIIGDVPGGQAMRQPIEDLDALVLSAYDAYSSLDLFRELAAQGVVAVITDRRHRPTSMVLPMS